MFFAQSTAKGNIRAKQNVFPPHVKILIHHSMHIQPSLRTEKTFRENEHTDTEKDKTDKQTEERRHT